MNPFIWLIEALIELVTWVVIASAILSWLVAFGVVNMRNQFIRMVVDTLYRITEPMLRPIRRVMPNLGGVDISPVILLLGLFFIVLALPMCAMLILTAEGFTGAIRRSPRLTRATDWLFAGLMGAFAVRLLFWRTD